jgi:hypothetical protein
MAKAKVPAGEILAACDRVRDDTLPQLGVRLEDRPDGKRRRGRTAAEGGTCRWGRVGKDEDRR